MNSVDPQKAARVWQRVQAQENIPKAKQEDLQELILDAWMASSTYLQLARQMPQKEAAVLQRLGREAQNHMNCLKGMYAIINGERPNIRPPKIQISTPELTLRRCYGAGIRSMKACEARTGDPEYGAMYGMLAQQGREHCRTLLELIGRLGKQTEK